MQESERELGEDLNRRERKVWQVNRSEKRLLINLMGNVTDQRWAVMDNGGVWQWREERNLI